MARNGPKGPALVKDTLPPRGVVKPALLVLLLGLAVGLGLGGGIVTSEIMDRHGWPDAAAAAGPIAPDVAAALPLPARIELEALKMRMLTVEMRVDLARAELFRLQGKPVPEWLATASVEERAKRRAAFYEDSVRKKLLPTPKEVMGTEMLAAAKAAQEAAQEAAQ